MTNTKDSSTQVDSDQVRTDDKIIKIGKAINIIFSKGLLLNLTNKSLDINK